MFQLTLPGGPNGTPFTVPEPSTFRFKGATTIGPVISELLKYVYPLAGLILFAMLIAGGFGLLTAAGNAEAIKKAQGRITSAFIGFVILFLAFWLVQILQAVFGLEKIF
jgi:positive regulator of sigma E activity